MPNEASSASDDDVDVDEFPQTKRTTLHRLPKRGVFDRTQVYGILDDAFLCHIAIVGPDGHPVTIPTSYARMGDNLVIHGKNNSRLMKAIVSGPVAISVSIIDGLVVGRSLFHSSMNYRGVVVFGQGEEVTSRRGKLQALKAFSDHVLTPERWEEARQPTDAELSATTVALVPLEEVSAKVRDGPVGDDAADVEADKYWAGVVPMRLVSGPPIKDAQVGAQVMTPSYMARFFGPGVVCADGRAPGPSDKPAPWMAYVAILFALVASFVTKVAWHFYMPKEE